MSETVNLTWFNKIKKEKDWVKIEKGYNCLNDITKDVAQPLKAKWKIDRHNSKSGADRSV